MPFAIALNNAAINASRAIGPAIAGILVAAVGAWLVFLLNALSYIWILVALLRWRREHHKSTLPAERFLSAIRVGMRFVMHTRALQMVLIRGLHSSCSPVRRGPFSLSLCGRSSVVVRRSMACS